MPLGFELNLKTTKQKAYRFQRWANNSNLSFWNGTRLRVCGTLYTNINACRWHTHRKLAQSARDWEWGRSGTSSAQLRYTDTGRWCRCPPGWRTSAAAQLPPDSTHSEATRHRQATTMSKERPIHVEWHQGWSCPYLDSKVYEATNVEGVLHEVKDELNVRDERQEIGHP